MALWGKTDALASTPKYVARKAFFDSTAVNTTAETINIIGSNTGFATGDAVYYSINGGTVIGGLTDATTYYVRVVGAGLIELYDTYARAINTVATTGRSNITAAGVGTHTLQRTGAANASTADKGTIVFVDAQEARADENKAKGLTGPGWWSYFTYTDTNSSTRHKAECLVAMAVGAVAAGDAEDTITVDLVLEFTTDPVDETIVAAEDVTFTGEAEINSGDAITYQWQVSEDDGSTWTNIVGATGTDLTLEEVAIESDGFQYRLVATAAAADVTATSAVATLTVTAE